jgi:hypothetical protein
MLHQCPLLRFFFWKYKEYLANEEQDDRIAKTSDRRDMHIYIPFITSPLGGFVVVSVSSIEVGRRSLCFRNYCVYPTSSLP